MELQLRNALEGCGNNTRLKRKICASGSNEELHVFLCICDAPIWVISSASTARLLGNLEMHLLQPQSSHQLSVRHRRIYFRRAAAAPVKVLLHPTVAQNVTGIALFLKYEILLLIVPSDEMSATDKENEDVENPKKRPRGAPFAPLPATRTTSQRPVTQPQILSPKSSNTRAQLARVPVRPINSSSPPKSHLARPTSPLKPGAPAPAGGASSILTNMVEKAKSTRAAASRKVTEGSNTSSAAPIGRGRRGAAAQPAAPVPRVGRGRGNSDSNSSETSTGTTVVRRAAPTAAAQKAPAKRTVMGTIKGMSGQGSKKLPAGKPAPPATSTGRVLRKRN